MLGLGAGPLGSLERDAGIALVHAALELGVTLFDTAPSYAASEEILGAALAGERRARAEIVTKGGYGVPNVADWTPEVLTQGIERALRVLSTDRIDVFLLHSCPAERLERGDLIEPLVRARREGKVLAVGYSGDGAGLAAAARIPEFDVLECSVSVLDREALGVIAGGGKRILAKRILGNAPWSPASDRSRADVAEYVRRYEALRPSQPGISDEELFVRFAAHAPGVSCALAGTRSRAHLEALVAAAAKGPLPEAILRDLAAKWRDHGAAWPGLV